MKHFFSFCLLIVMICTPVTALFSQELLIGTDHGLFTLNNGKPIKLPGFPDTIEYRRIIKTTAGWYFLTSAGILFSGDLQSYETRNDKLPVKTLKTLINGQKKLTQVQHELKDLEFDPYNQNILVTCTKDAAYISYNGGKSWSNIGNPSDSNGIKAVAVFSQPKLTVLLSSAVRGLYMVELPKGSWKRVPGNFAQSCPTTSPDEIADIQVEQHPLGTGNQLEPGTPAPILWAVNSFLPIVYKASGTDCKFEQVYKGESDFFSLDSISLTGSGFYAVSDHQLLSYSQHGGIKPAIQEQTLIETIATLLPETLLSLYFSGVRNNSSAPGSSMSNNSSQYTPVVPAPAVPGSTASNKSNRSPLRVSGVLLDVAPGAFPALSLSELWFFSKKPRNLYTTHTLNKNGIYLQTGYVINEQTRSKYIEFIKQNNINMLTIDLKDDYGRLRYISNDPFIKAMYKPGNTLDIDSFTREMKAQGIYLVARIVVFKDQHMYAYGGGKYAVYDAKNKTSWQGYYLKQSSQPSTAQPSASQSSNGQTSAHQASQQSGSASQEKVYYKEYWVDPYCEEIWKYNIAIAREVLARGFDEVQFDYIRFPTDGVNIGNATYRWRDPGMDKESALMSFLQYARESIPGPISIDIYGVNGWYRSGVRTGQDVELLSRYVDVICPMFYPSHFEQSFLAFAPPEERPYRIYKLGSLRTWTIGKKRIIVRPYVQAFYMNVSYDRLYYSKAYVAKEVDGVYQAVNQGMTFWNNAGRYDDIPIITAPGADIVSDFQQEVLD